MLAAASSSCWEHANHGFDYVSQAVPSCFCDDHDPASLQTGAVSAPPPGLCFSCKRLFQF